MIKVAVVDRNPLFIDTVMRAIDLQPDLTAVSGSFMWQDFVRPSRDADVIALLYEPFTEMVSSAIKRIHREIPDARIVLVGAPDESQVLDAYIDAGIAGYTWSSDSIEVLAGVIRSVASHAAGEPVGPASAQQPDSPEQESPRSANDEAPPDPATARNSDPHSGQH